MSATDTNPPQTRMALASLLQVLAQVRYEVHLERFLRRLELRPHDLATIDANVGCLIELDFENIERVFAKLERVRAMVTVHQPVRLNDDADFLFELARGCCPSFFVCANITAGQRELSSVGVLDEQDSATVPDRDQSTGRLRPSYKPNRA